MGTPRNQSSVFTMETVIIPAAEKARQLRSKIKVMLIVFFDSCGIVHHEYAPQSQTTVSYTHLDVYKRQYKHPV